MIAVILIDKNFDPIVTELFVRGRKLNISLVLFRCIRVNSKYYFVMKTPNKRELK